MWVGISNIRFECFFELHSTYLIFRSERPLVEKWLFNNAFLSSNNETGFNYSFNDLVLFDHFCWYSHRVFLRQFVRKLPIWYTVDYILKYLNGFNIWLNSSFDHPGDDHFTVENINPHSCTHLVYFNLLRDVNINSLQIRDQRVDIIGGGFKNSLFWKTTTQNSRCWSIWQNRRIWEVNTYYSSERLFEWPSCRCLRLSRSCFLNESSGSFQCVVSTPMR